MGKMNSAPNIPIDFPQEEIQERQTYDYATEIVDLPSKGLLYPDTSPLASGKIEMKYMTAKEEDILSTQSLIRSGMVLDRLYESMIVSKGVKYNDILIGDKNAIMIYARIFGYGPLYRTTATTPDGRNIDVEFDLREVKFKELNEKLITKGENLFQFDLPTSKAKITFKLLTVGDQKQIKAELEGLQKYGKGGALTTPLRFMIQSVNGNDSKNTINNFVNNMPVADTKAFREYLAEVQPDLDLSVELEDPETGEPFRSDINLGFDLFYPDFKA